MKITSIDLPNEILSIIINELAPSDTENNHLETLAACRLASHTIYSLATPLFFSSIQLTESGASCKNDRIAAFEKRAVELNHLLTNNDIAASVQSFMLSCDAVRLEDSLSSGIIMEILHHLPHIQNFALEVSGNEYLWSPIQFFSIAEDLSLAIRALFNSPNLTRMDLCNIFDFPRTLITAFPNLEYLRLRNIEFETFDVNSVFSIPPAIINPIFQYDNVDNTSNWEGSYLNSLEIDEASLISLGACLGDSEHMSFPEYFSRLKNLHHENEDMMLNYAWDFVLQTSQTLTSLEIYRDLERMFHLCIEDYGICCTHYKNSIA